MRQLSWQTTALICTLIAAGVAVWCFERSRDRYSYKTVRRGQVDLVYKIDRDTQATTLVAPGKEAEPSLLDRTSTPVSAWEEWAHELGFATRLDQIDREGAAKTAMLVLAVASGVSLIVKALRGAL